MSADISTRIERLLDQLEVANTISEIALIEKKIEVLREQQS